MIHKTKNDYYNHFGYCYKFSVLIIFSVILLSSFVILSLLVYNFDVLKKNSIQSLRSVEDKMFTFTKSIHNDEFHKFMVFFTDFGRNIIWPLILILLFIFGRREGRITALIMLFSFIIIIPVNSILKDMINRDRPLIDYYSQSIDSPKDSSFPSGHASLVSAGALCVALFFRSSKRKKILSTLLILEAGLVCFSRIYLGAHYPTDVLGGILLGTGIVFAVGISCNKLYVILRYLKWRD